MKIDILCSNKSHPIYPKLQSWVDSQAEHDCELLCSKDALVGGDFLFLISCTELIKSEIRDLYKHTFVIHASNLPQGRGWSPHVWAVVNGESKITVSLIEALDAVDTGDIWLQDSFELEGHELFDEINELLFASELKLMSDVIANYNDIKPVTQDAEIQATYYRKREPDDSRIDVNKSIAEQFNLLRVADNERYPSFFEHLGVRYKIKLEKA